MAPNMVHMKDRSAWEAPEKVLERENKTQRSKVRVEMKGGKNVKYV